MRKTWPVIFLLAVVCSCQSGGGDLKPIVIDLSKPTPSPTQTPQPSPTPTSAPETPTLVPPTAVVTASPIPSQAAGMPATTPTAAAAMTPEAVVELQLAAYNRRDVEGFAANYSDDAVIYDPPERIRDAGIEAIRRTYSKAFADAPAARATISQRLVQGSFVIDQERISGLPGGEARSAVVIYEVRTGKIVRVWVIK